jgi:hypothetical protein
MPDDTDTFDRRFEEHPPPNEPVKESCSGLAAAGFHAFALTLQAEAVLLQIRPR